MYRTNSMFSVEPRTVPAVTAWPTITRHELAPQSSVVYIFEEPTVKAPVQANLDGWPNSTIDETVMIRFGSQANCAFNCNFCIASQSRAAKNLSAEQIVGQVLTVLSDPLIDRERVKKIVVASFGLGEPFFNPNVVGAFEALFDLLPDAKFIVSTTGPKHGERVFAKLIEYAGRHRDFNLQISLHCTTDAERFGFVGAPLHPISGLSDWSRRWYDVSGAKTIINCGVGPLFPIWTERDYECLAKFFLPTTSHIKLSVEAPMNPDDDWDISGYQDEIRRRQECLTAAGYTIEYYNPSGLTDGAGCGSQLTQIELSS